MKQIILVGILALFLVSCSGTPHDNGMKAQLDAIRVMIKQSALMATNAACADIKERDMLIHAAAAQARRAMGGSEMFKIHKMMNMEPDSIAINMSMKKSKSETMSSKMKMHVALHDAGEAVFDFLDSMGGNPGISCNQSSAVLLAASAAMLRESSVEEANTVIKQLDQSVASILKEQNQVLIPAPVRTLATALQHI